MEDNQDMFSIKIQELNQQYEQLKNQIKNYQNGDANTIRQEIIRIEDEYKENNIILQNMIDESRSQAASKLAAAQLDYNNKTMEILTEDSLDSEESSALYAEYAIDFASQAMQHSLLAVLCAILKNKEE